MFSGKQKGLGNIWRVIVCLAAFNVIAVLAVLMAGFIYLNVNITSFSKMISDTMNSDAGYTLAIAIMVMLFLLLLRYIVKKEKLTWKQLGFQKEHCVSSVIKGFMIGIVFIVLYIAILVMMNQLVFEYRALTIGRLYSLAMGLIIFSGVAFAEELTFRGYLQYMLGRKNQTVGMILSAGVFALNHLLNIQNYTLLSLVYLMMGGILFGVIRMKTKNIWFPLGFHIAWNWTEIRVFGLGNHTDNHWLTTYITQDSLWNGGESGSGLILIMIEVLMILVFIFLYPKMAGNDSIKKGTNSDCF